MKKHFFAFVLASVLPIALSAGELIPATTLKLHSADGLTNLEALDVELNYSCAYKVGFIFPENKSCGDEKIKLKVGEDGVVRIPALEKFRGFFARKIDNYAISLSVHDGKDFLVVLSARGGSTIKKFNFEGKRLDLYRLDESVINVSYEGADFFGSGVSKVDRAHLSVSVSNTQKDPGYYDDVLVITSLEGTGLWWRENFPSYEGKIQLKDEKEIRLSKLNYAKFDSSEKEEITFYISYAVSNDYQGVKLRATMTTPLKGDALAKIGTVELRKY